MKILNKIIKLNTKKHLELIDITGTVLDLLLEVNNFM